MIIKQIHIDDEQYRQVYDLREAVLRQPIGLSLKNEDLSGDKLDIILIAEEGQRVIGCVMLHPTEITSTIKLRQMAVDDNWQGKGVGKQLVQASEELCKKQGINKIILHARTTAQRFYDKLGYTATSGVFTEVGIAHIIMEKQLI